MSDKETRDAAASAGGKERAGAGESPKERSARSGGAAKRKGSQKAGPPTGMLVVVALLLGGAAGWFARHAQAQTLESQAATSESGEGACQTWEAEICSGAGAEALACYEAKAAANLLPAAACDTALSAVPDTLARVAASREVCKTVVDKLCTDLGTESPTCGMVREKTELFPAERCKEMLENYDDVLGELRMLEQQMGQQQMGQPPMGQPPMPPPGAAPPSAD